MAYTIDLAKAGTSTIPFGDASPVLVGRIVFQVVNTSSLSTSGVLKARVPGATTSVDVPYYNRNAETTLIAAGTAITSAGIYEVNAAGVEIFFDNTYTSGAGLLVVNPLLG